MEDRVLGKAKDKTMELKSFKGSGLSLESPGLVFDYLAEKTYCSTMKDGNIGQIDITEDSMSKLQNIFQQVVDALPWSGFKQHVP